MKNVQFIQPYFGHQRANQHLPSTLGAIKV